MKIEAVGCLLVLCRGCESNEILAIYVCTMYTVRCTLYTVRCTHGQKTNFNVFVEIPLCASKCIGRTFDGRFLGQAFSMFNSSTLLRPRGELINKLRDWQLFEAH